MYCDQQQQYHDDEDDDTKEQKFAQRKKENKTPLTKRRQLNQYSRKNSPQNKIKLRFPRHQTML
jgi:hypothetical protein